LIVAFFFSSRRRHTRSKRDWSSDVCSSDLGAGHAHEAPGLALATTVEAIRVHTEGDRDDPVRVHAEVRRDIRSRVPGDRDDLVRSEERRVGKEWRARWAREHGKRKDDVEND